MGKPAGIIWRGYWFWVLMATSLLIKDSVASTRWTHRVKLTLAVRIVRVVNCVTLRKFSRLCALNTLLLLTGQDGLSPLLRDKKPRKAKPLTDSDHCRECQT
ncbi:Uncharacterised protein [Serratia quinivorans]|nr:Uncharacterised protein [Serratia quinivorans]